MSQKQRTHTRGFTLLELLMVVIIIAILAAIAVPQYIRTVERSRMSEAVAILGQMRQAQIRYKTEFTTGYAPNLLALDIDTSAAGMSGTPLFAYTIGGTATGESFAKRIPATVFGNCKASYKVTLKIDGTWVGRDCQAL